MFKGFTAKQEDFLLDILDNDLSRINILTGSVRSGKTFISIIGFLMVVAKSRPDDTFLMAGKTITSLKRNCFDLIESICGKHFKYSTGSKEGELFSRKVYIEGVNDARAENKIRGMTLSGAYCDEITLFTEDFFSMLLSRLSKPNAKLIGTTNPDAPTHWLKANYIDRKDKLDLKLWEFIIDDNTTLDKAWVHNIKQEYTGVFYDRFILGQWVQAEGLIYRIFADNKDKYIFDKLSDNLSFITIGIDYGASVSKTVFVGTGISLGMKKVYVLSEDFIEGVQEPDAIYNRFIAFYNNICNKYGKPHIVYADYGALGQVLTRGLQNACLTASLPVKIVDCKKGTINDRIQLSCQLFGQDRLFINKSCTHTIDAFSRAVWEEKKIDTRLDNGSVEIDFLDAFEYSIYDFNKKLISIH